MKTRYWNRFGQTTEMAKIGTYKGLCGMLTFVAKRKPWTMLLSKIPQHETQKQASLIIFPHSLRTRLLPPNLFTSCLRGKTYCSAPFFLHASQFCFRRRRRKNLHILTFMKKSLGKNTGRMCRNHVKRFLKCLLIRYERYERKSKKKCICLSRCWCLSKKAKDKKKMGFEKGVK